MENMTMSNVAMAAMFNESLPALASHPVHGASSIIRVVILSILGIAFAFLVLRFCCQCLTEDDRRPHSRATMGSYSVCMHEDDTRSQPDATRGTYSEHMRHEMRSDSGSAAGMMCLVMVLLIALVAFVVGVVKLLGWLVHVCGAMHVPHWLANLWDSATSGVIHAWHSVEIPLLLVLGISIALVSVLYCGLWVMGFVDYGIAPGSFAAAWMSSTGNVVGGSLYSILQMIAAGGISVLYVLLYILPVVALVVGVFEIIVWLAPSGAIHVPTWLVDSWDSSSAWVRQAWNSAEFFGWWNGAVAWLHNLWDSVSAWVLDAWNSFEIFGWWDSFVAWLHNLWVSITDHHKWKIYT